MKGKTSTVAYIALELVDGCELMDLLIGHGGFSEPIARYFFKQMLSGILFCHNQGMSHRDLKPENMLVNTENMLKLCDFGFAKDIQGDKGDGKAYSFVGTPCYMDPQIFMRKGKAYDAQKADLWSLGVILFITMYGNFPFNEPDPRTDSFFGAIYKNNWDNFWKAHDASLGGSISNELRELLSMMMHPNKNVRPTIADIIGHAWTNGPMASEAEIVAELDKRRAANKAQADEQEASERFNNEAHRDFMLHDKHYYSEFDTAGVADNENATILKVKDWDEDEHDYRVFKKAEIAPDQIFSQLKSLLSTEGVTEDGLTMSDDSWRLEIISDKINDENQEEEKKEEDQDGEVEEKFVVTERVKMICEILNKDGGRYIFAKKVSGSYRQFMHLWDQIKAKILLME